MRHYMSWKYTLVDQNLILSFGWDEDEWGRGVSTLFQEKGGEVRVTHPPFFHQFHLQYMEHSTVTYSSISNLFHLLQGNIFQPYLISSLRFLVKIKTPTLARPLLSILFIVCKSVLINTAGVGAKQQLLNHSIQLK